MSTGQVWLITGASRGMGVDIAETALAAGHSVVATARSAHSITKALGEHENLFPMKLDITNPADAETAVDATTDRFGHIDILVNNAGNFYAGFFEEITDKD